MTLLNVRTSPGADANEKTGGSDPAPPPLGAGGEAWPAPNMFAFPGTLRTAAREADDEAQTIVAMSVIVSIDVFIVGLVLFVVSRKACSVA